MARPSNTIKEQEVFNEVHRHAQLGFNETDTRGSGRGRIGTISFDEVDELFRSWINENDWPFDALLFDPRVFTAIVEKNSRLIASKLRGRLIPREGSDVLGAKINNELLSFQWDQANRGGSMIQKWKLMDLNTRKYGAAFALCKWWYETDDKERTLFDGPDMKVLSNRDCAHDLTATSIENCRWFQVREYVTLEDLLNVNDRARTKPIYKNLDRLRDVLGNESDIGGGDTRGINWTSRNRQIAGLEADPYGKDPVFKTFEIITEYRRDRWITFANQHSVIIRDIENPYKNNEIPITMLRYYVIDDDLYGLSEIEPIKSLQKAINALLSEYVDEISQKLYSPVAVGPGVRQHTLEWGKGARWVMNNPMTDFRLVESASNATQFFSNTYSVLVSAMLSALGETSLGVSNVQPMQGDKTATEVKALVQQRNARDNSNQIELAESIKRQMMLWYSMNQLLLFSDPKKKNYIIRVVGKDAIKFFKEAGLNETIVDEEKTSIINENSEEVSSALGEVKATDFLKPKFPVNIGTEKEPNFVPKMQLEELEKTAKVYIEPDDLKGNFDFIADVESMSLRSPDDRKSGRQTAVTLLLTNPNIIALLQQEGVRPRFKDLFISWLEDSGFSDAEKFFETAPQGGVSQTEGQAIPPQLIEKSMGVGQPNGQRQEGPSQESPTQLPKIPGVTAG